MNTIMDNLLSCGRCDKTIRLLKYNSLSMGQIAVEAESTAPEDLYFDPKRHVPHRARCANDKPKETTEMPLVKKPCNCGEKEFKIMYPNLRPYTQPMTITNIMQHRVEAWVVKCFGENILFDEKERIRRFIEEAFELAQAAGLTIQDLAHIGNYVYGREVGKVAQEIGGCGVTLLGIGPAFGIDVMAEIEKEILRIESIDPEHFRNKHKEKSKAGVSSDVGSGEK